MFLAKIANDRPTALLPLKDACLNVLRNDELPHAVISFLGQTCCLKLEAYFPGTFSSKELSFIRMVLRPAKNKGVLPVALTKDKLRFRFDSTDTIPYWYQPLCGLFDVEYNLVPSMADAIITDHWHFTGDVNKDDHVSSDDNRYSGTRHSHYDVPAVENLRSYYEFNAMICVAMQLLKLTVLTQEKEEAWIDWVSKWLYTFENLWLSDLRDPVPLEWILWDAEQPERWLSHVPLTHERTFLQFESHMPVVAADIVIYYGKDHESIRINSAMVSAASAQALWRSLQETPMHRYRLPEYEEDQHEILSPGFDLLGWLTQVSGNSNGADDFDPYAENVKKTFFEVGGLFDEIMPVRISEDHRRTFDGNGRQVALFENWTNATLYPESTGVETTGQRLKFDHETLLSWLAQAGFSLLIECQIDRYPERDNYSEKPRQNYKQKNLYLIEKDGTVKTIKGDLKLGKKAGS